MVNNKNTIPLPNYLINGYNNTNESLKFYCVLPYRNTKF